MLLIAPDLPLNQPGANYYDLKEYTLKNYRIFAKLCKVATVQTVLDY